MEYNYETKGVCPKLIKFNMDGDIITNVKFLGGGCPGNLQALPKLVEGSTVQEIKEKLKGIKCGFKETSCADQLATAVIEAYEKSKVTI